MARELTADFPVTDESPIPAPGDRAPKTENLTLESKEVPKAAIDSMAAAGGEIPDPELHQETVADAIENGSQRSCLSARRRIARVNSADPKSGSFNG